MAQATAWGQLNLGRAAGGGETEISAKHEALDYKWTCKS